MVNPTDHTDLDDVMDHEYNSIYIPGFLGTSSYSDIVMSDGWGPCRPDGFEIWARAVRETYGCA